MTHGRSTDYGLAPALRARLMGIALVGIGLTLLVATVLVISLHLPGDVLSAAVLLTVVAVFGLGFFLVRRWFVVRLDTDGYQVRFVRGAGVRAARWSDVQDLQTTFIGGARCVQLRLRDGRTTTIPVDLIAGDSDAFVDDLREHLGSGTARKRNR